MNQGLASQLTAPMLQAKLPPLVLASGAGANARHSIGTGIIGGMVGATTLALFFVPLFYYLIRKGVQRVSAERKASPASP